MPVVVAVVLFTVMMIWKRGRAVLGELFARKARPIDEFLADVESKCHARVPGIAVFLTGHVRWEVQGETVFGPFDTPSPASTL